MHNPFNTLCLLCSLLLLTAGCQPVGYRHDGSSGVENRKIADKEQLLLRTKNYESLIALTRDSLKKKEDPEVRFRLAEYYFLAGNYNSSLHYLLVSLNKNPSPRVYLLQSKNLTAQQNYDAALKFTDMVIQKEPANGEALNLRGVILAQKGDLPQAMASFEQARNAFYPEEKAINNIALVHIADRRYSQAIQLLLPVYLRGYRDNHLTHNLIFALVKAGDLRYAKEIIKRENITRYPDTLIAALFEVESNLSSL
ncbi:tetratricopeptide repeat protein [Pantoea sp. BAV 3049]|uniref:tetratricopeptide repeat protein n=1 Tax=Pantoea sp. BAV 3049 TaxID=2654188 RepID=UPI00131B6B2E|nr:tetratricopeptide repeat protein [Pantoea sp. BAV 3049]